MKKGLVLVALIVLAVPTAHAASPGGKSTPRATTASPQGADESPAKACKAERAAMGVDAFAKKYGTNQNLRNAFGKCVSGKSRGKDETDEAEKGKNDNEKSETAEKDEKDDSAAVKPCKKERTDLGAEAFAKKYGTNHNRANAFGKCVSGSPKNKTKRG